LRNKTVVARLGGEIGFLAGAANKGYVAPPQKTSASAVSWLAEGVAPSQSNMSIGQTVIQPSTAAITTLVTRQMLLEGMDEFLSFMINDILVGLVVAIDNAAIAGTGPPNQPLGLLNRGSGIPSIKPANDSGNGGAPVYADLTALQYAVGSVNGDAPFDARMGFLTSPAGRLALQQCDIEGTTVTGRMVWGSARLMEVNGELRSTEVVLGYPACASNQVPANMSHGTGTVTAGVMGNFADLFINMFGGFDFILNPYLQTSTASPGNVGCSGFVDCGVLVRRGNSFCTLAGWTFPNVTITP
jgi:HK97 family phage major capsid protein